MNAVRPDIERRESCVRVGRVPRHLRPAWPILLASFLAILPGMAPEAFGQSQPAGDRAAPDGIHVECREGLLTVELVDATLDAVLERIAGVCGIRLTLRAPAREQIDLAFEGVPLEAGLRRILGGRTSVMLYSKDRTLAEIRIYGAGDAAGPVAGTLEQLHGGLQSPDSAARIRAIDAIGQQDSPAAVDLIAEALEQDPDAAVRAHAAMTLAVVGGDGALEALESALGDGEPAVQAEIIRSLANLGGERATMAIAQVLLGDASPAIRALAADALASQGTERARLFLEAALEDEDEEVRARARAGLAR